MAAFDLDNVFRKSRNLCFPSQLMPGTLCSKLEQGRDRLAVGLHKESGAKIKDARKKGDIGFAVDLYAFSGI